MPSICHRKKNREENDKSLRELKKSGGLDKKKNESWGIEDYMEQMKQMRVDVNRGLILPQLFTWSEGQKSLSASASSPAALINISTACDSIVMKTFIIEKTQLRLMKVSGNIL